MFESADDDAFVLVVENKLFSGFGPDQLKRYQAALRVVRGHGGRGGLIALTRDVPTSGELRPDAGDWLGSVRWARILPRLRTLSVADSGVAAQWQLLLDVLDEQGDLGMTQIDAGAVRAWSRYYEGREQLQWLLEQIFAETLDYTRSVLAKAHRRLATREELAALWYKGKARRVLIQQSQSEMRFGISVPAAYTDQSLQIAVWMENPGEIRFGVTVLPRDAADALDRRDAQLLRQLKALTERGFVQTGSSAAWFTSHDGNAILNSPDVPAALLEAIKPDLSAIADSKILTFDLTGPLPRAKRRKKAEPWG